MRSRVLPKAISLVDAHQGPASEFALAMPDLLNDPAGINMALIGDRILRRGWLPNGFTQLSGCRVYRYKEID
jgi:hypothetical protein